MGEVSLRVQDVAGRRVLVVGYGLTGRAVAAFCARHGISFAVSDGGRLAPAEEAWLRAHATGVETGGHSERLLAAADLVIPSPGVPPGLPLIAAARARGVPVWSELDLASRCVGRRRIVAVTGTNGKSTTVGLIGRLLDGTAVRPVVAGNIGLPFLDVADRTDWDVAVLEVSSFQLEQSELLHPQVGVLLNLAPNHLERHGSMAAYVAAKLRLFAHQTAADAAVLPSQLAGVDHGRGRLVVFDSPFPPLPRGSDEVGDVRRLNLAAAVAACREVVPDFDPTTRSVEDLHDALFLPFRQQTVGTIRGIRVINDSKATSPAATIAALLSTCEPAVVLLGGRSKRGGYDELAAYLAASPARGVVVFGEAKAEISEQLVRAAVPHVVVHDLEAAVGAGLALAQSGDALLLSPACSSFDAFASYEERGEAFNRIAERLTGFRAVADS